YTILITFSIGDANEPGTIVLRESYHEQFNITINDGWLILDYWPEGRFAERAFFVLAFTDTILIFASFTSVALSTMTFYHTQMNTLVSDANRKSQRMVLIALCVQAIVPFLCVYIPYVSNLNAPFLGVANLVPQELSASFISAFPLWDAAVIILLMKDYRVGARTLLLCGQQTKVEPFSHLFFTTFTVPSQI
ncbi:hypothetical protein PMAYCL1PPCAC_15735, partial [Pristionchus mayeri]